MSVPPVFPTTEIMVSLCDMPYGTVKPATETHVNHGINTASSFLSMDGHLGLKGVKEKWPKIQFSFS